MLPKPLIMILIAAAAAIFVVALRLALRRRKRRKQFEEIAQLKQRDEALNEALRNPQAGAAGSAQAKGPIEVSWEDKTVRSPGAASGGAMVELIELSAYSRRKYIFRTDQPITIGSGKDNQLMLCREGVEAQHCEIRMNGGKPCIRSLAGARTVLTRKKTSVLVSAEGIYLNNGDHIQLGESELQFRLFKG